MRQMAKLLPPDDAGLDSLLAEIIAANAASAAFMAVVVTATHADGGRTRGIWSAEPFSFPAIEWLGRVAIRMHGDASRAFADGGSKHPLEPGQHRGGSPVSGRRADARTTGKSLPAAFMPLARAAARRLKQNSTKKDDIETFSMLRSLAARIGDPELMALLRQRYSKLNALKNGMTLRCGSQEPGRKSGDQPPQTHRGAGL